MDIFSAVIAITVLVFSSILHEIAHGFVALKLGDPTAKHLGRLTLNPIKHIDPFMSVLFPLILIFSGSPIIFGGAKPVPINPLNLKDGHKDLALTALAGPATNLLLAIIAAMLMHIIYPQMSINEIQMSGILGFIFYYIVVLNLLLAVFNLIPIPPLDGSKVFASLLPRREAAAYLSLDSIGLFIVFFLLFFPLGPFSLMGAVQNMLVFALSLLGF